MGGGDKGPTEQEVIGSGEDVFCDIETRVVMTFRAVFLNAFCGTQEPQL